MASRDGLRKRVVASGGADERIFFSTASIVPQDRRGSSRGSWTTLRKPQVHRKWISQCVRHGFLAKDDCSLSGFTKNFLGKDQRRSHSKMSLRLILCTFYRILFFGEIWTWYIFSQRWCAKHLYSASCSRGQSCHSETVHTHILMSWGYGLKCWQCVHDDSKILLPLTCILWKQDGVDTYLHIVKARCRYYSHTCDDSKCCWNSHTRDDMKMLWLFECW